jgi:hypothetical protein
MKRSTAALAVLLLSACGGNGGNESAGSGEKAAGGGTAGGNVAMQAGQWEMTTQVVSMTAEGLPAGMTPPTPPPTTVSICLTPEQAANPGANFATGSAENSGCTSENMAMANGRVTGTVQCAQGGTTMRTTLDGQYTATSYEVTQRAQISGQGVSMNTESRTTGRRTGDCAAGG